MTNHEVMPEGEEHPPRGVQAMGIVRWALVAAMAIAAAASLARCRRDDHTHEASAQQQRWTCPMHPQIVRDQPGECPICGMTLVPLTVGGAKPDEAADGSTPPGLTAVDLSPERVQLIGVRTAKVTRKSVGGTLRTAGAVAANERGLAQISARFSGWIDRLLVQETGAHVRRGQAVATIYSPELLQAQQELISALRWSASPSRPPTGHAGHTESTEGLVDDARGRLELLGISPQEIAAIAREGKPRRALELRSPVDGTVVVRNAVLGMAVQPGVPLFEVADLSTVWVIAEIYASDVARVRVGQPARFETSSLPGDVWKGKVQFVYPNVDPQTRTLRLRIELRNRPGGAQLRPGMYGDVTLDLPAADGLAVPTEAVVDTGDVKYVFVDKGGGRFEPRVVQVGGRSGNEAIVTKGVSDGETVVTTANFLIDSESRLRAAIEGRAQP